MNHLIAAIDLGSNSFRLLIGRVVTEAGIAQVFPVDRMKETVRLAAGLRTDKVLDDAAVDRAVAVLERFGERLRSFHPDRVRAVATNTFRVARNVADFLPRAEAALGFPIEIIAGREEARLIFAGVAHSLPASPAKRLVVDIGGGSTEFIVGRGHEPELMESLYMGCVSFSQRFFPGGRIEAWNMKEAEMAARREVEIIGRSYRKAGWKEAFGSSGTAKALTAILTEMGWSDDGITRKGMLKLREALIKAGSVQAANLKGIKASRIEVLPGGLAIMMALFDELGIERMLPADGALRLGVLYDLLGREAAQDQRHDTVRLFMMRYEVDAAQALRVRRATLELYSQLKGPIDDDEELRAVLGWTADLHEAGLSISHAGYQKHSAYILEHADMPGFSRREQQRMAQLALWHVGKLQRPEGPALPQALHLPALALRLASLLMRRREDLSPLPLQAGREGETVLLRVDSAWLAEHPMTDYALRSEASEWRKVGLTLKLLEV